jgi:type IV fimbrial biogenesis protein FimT
VGRSLTPASAAALPFDPPMIRIRPNPLSKPPRGALRGFTLIEMVIVVTIVGILAALAGPSFRDMVVRQRIRTAGYDLMADLTFARSEAIKRNSSVTITKGGSNWSGGWTITDAGGATLRSHPALADTITITMGTSSVDFLLNGRASAAARFTIDDAGGKSAIPARCIAVDPSGRPRSTEGSCT